ncbi:MAG: hypothetical protein EOO90_13320 [Pedobacter sp.]|nr:MAG: hypothetical protein EOO90_13320 [Pedobacter sp.]
MKRLILLALLSFTLMIASAKGSNTYPIHIDTLVSAGMFNVKNYGAIGNGIANDAPAFQRAIDSAYAKGGGVVIVPAGRYNIKAAIIPKSRVTLRGSGLGAVLMSTSFIPVAIGQPTADLEDFSVQNLTMEGGVTDEGVFPRNSRNYTASFTSAITMQGSRLPGGTYPKIKNISIINCKFLKIRGLPFFFQGISDQILVTGCYFENCLDAGFIYCESVQFIGNCVKKGADNGVSVSRGTVKAVIANNIFEDVAYWGVWCSGFNEQTGTQSFSITGNVMKRSGYGGIALLNGPRYGTVTGNTIDTVFNGPTDKPSKTQGVGIMITPLTSGGVKVQDASQIVISSNLIRHAARGGVSLKGASDILITGNSFINVGATDTLISRVNYNSGIYTDDFSVVGAGLNRIGVVGNTFTDNRTTSFSNFAIAPAIRTSTNSYQNNNTMFGFRQPLGERLTVGGNTDADEFIAINAKSGALRELLFQTAGVRRWDLRVSNVAETGGQIGSDLSFIRRNDDGTVAGIPLAIARADGGIKLVETTGKIGFFGVTPISKYTAIPNTTGASLTDLELEVNKLKALLRSYGLMVP